MANEGRRIWSIIKNALVHHKDFLGKGYLVVAHEKGQFSLEKAYVMTEEEANALEDLKIEVRFTYVNIEAIQAVKKHMLVDHERTPLTKASELIVLKIS